MTDIVTCPVARPYARDRKSPPSVTTILGKVIDKPGLPWAAVDETLAHLAAHPELMGEPSVRSHFRGVWDRRALVGTITHGVNRAWAFGEEPDMAAIATEALTNKDGSLRKGWTPEFVTAAALEAHPYVDALERWWGDWQPEWLAVEHVVRHPKPNSYVGQCDGIARLADGHVWMLDFKTTKNEDEKVYPGEWRLQLAAYSFAKELVLYDDAGNVTGAEPNDFGVERHAIVQLRADGTYRFYPVRVGREEHSRFLQARCVWEWLSVEADKPACAHLDRPDSLVEVLTESLAAEAERQETLV